MRIPFVILAQNILPSKELWSTVINPGLRTLDQYNFRSMVDNIDFNNEVSINRTSPRIDFVRDKLCYTKINLRQNLLGGHKVEKF